MKQNLTNPNESLYKLGDLVTYLTNPFLKSVNELVLKAKSEYTPPVLVVFEINNPKNFNEQTGKKDVQYNCIFFNSKTCLFERKWFKETELKFVSDYENGSGNEFETISLSDAQQYVNKKFILKSVDVELKKLKSNFEKTDNVKTKITAHLDFVSPILTVLEVLSNENKKVFDNITGTKLRSAVLFKCKWFNAAKQTFSEDLIPSNVLTNVEQFDISKSEFSFDKDNYYLFPESTVKDKVYEVQDIVELLNISFNTYYYEFVYKNIFTQKINNMILTQDNISAIQEIPREDVFSSELIGINPQRIFKQLTPSTFKKGAFYKIVYKDKMAKITERMIYVIDIIAFNKSFTKVTLTPTQRSKTQTLHDLHCYIEAYCLLRNGDKRHFILNHENILSVKKFLL